jgi:hypothetical protein
MSKSGPKVDIADAPLLSGRVFVPGEVTLESDHLIWWLTKPSFRTPGTGLLEGFRRLHGATDEEILKYARMWGVFGLCECGLPASHSNTLFAKQRTPTCDWIAAKPSGYVENLAVWRRYSRAVFALTHIAARVAQDRVVESEDEFSYEDEGPRFKCWDEALMFGNARPEGAPMDWAKLDIVHTGGRPQSPTKASRLRVSRGLICRQIDTWLELGRVGPRLVSGDSWMFKIGMAPHAFPNLFGILAVKLMHAIAFKDGPATCSACDMAYYPMLRRPSAHRNNFCQRCHEDGGKARFLKRLQRERARDQRL